MKNPTEITISLTKSQIEFLKLTKPFCLFRGGYGCGKSHLMGFCAVRDAMHGGGTIIGVYEPDHSLLKSVAIPSVVYWLDQFNIKYKIDNYGNIYSYRLNKLLLPKVTRWGYREVTLRDKTGNPKSYLVHLLIAKYFLNHSTLSGLVVNHKDGNKQNNRLDNLEIVTKSRNSKHAYEIGLNISRKGEESGLSKLKNEEIIKIRELSKILNHREIAERFNVSRGLISRILSGHIWKHI